MIHSLRSTYKYQFSSHLPYSYIAIYLFFFLALPTIHIPILLPLKRPKKAINKHIDELINK